MLLIVQLLTNEVFMSGHCYRVTVGQDGKDLFWVNSDKISQALENFYSFIEEIRKNNTKAYIRFEVNGKEMTRPNLMTYICHAMEQLSSHGWMKEVEDKELYLDFLRGGLVIITNEPTGGPKLGFFLGVQVGKTLEKIASLDTKNVPDLSIFGGVHETLAEFLKGPCRNMGYL